jgi:hypothetical protein
MVLSSSKRVSLIASISNQSQGGGSKKAGFPAMVGRSSWGSIYLNSVNPATGHCCTLENTQTMLFPLASISRPIGYNGNRPYWNIA